MEKNPNDYFSDLLREIANESGLSDPEIVRRHDEVYKGRKLNAATINRFRRGETPVPGMPPKLPVQQAIAVATGVPLVEIWRKATRQYAREE